MQETTDKSDFWRLLGYSAVCLSIGGCFYIGELEGPIVRINSPQIIHNITTNSPVKAENP